MNRHALSPELQPLLNEQLPEPPARARALWKVLAKRMKKLDQDRTQQASYDAEVFRLREELTLARVRDNVALGKALAAGKPEPEPEATAIESEIERNVKRSAAMTNEILEAQRSVIELVVRLKEAWQGDLERHIADAAALYRASIVQLEQTRQELTELVNVGGWLVLFPQTGGGVQTAYLERAPLVDPLSGHPERETRPQRTFNAVRDELLQDCERLPAVGPIKPTREYLRAMDKRQLIVDRVDSEGTVHPAIFKAQ